MLSPSRLGVFALIGLAGAGPGAVGAPAGDRQAAASARLDENPCLKAVTARRLRCPDLRMSPPAHMFLSRTRSGRLRLHAENSINSVGRGPAELRGRRDGRYTMAAKQVIYRRDGRKRWLDTGARLGFKAVPGQYRYWKYIHAARFELWRLDKRGRRLKRVRTGPKQSYCLRDLQRRNPQVPRSPSVYHYPSCSQDLSRRRDTLGTSVGWSDVYPSTYHEQYINVTGLRGCFAYIHVADPKNGIYESNERNNVGETIVRLPWRGAGRHGCPGKSSAGGPEGGAEAPGAGY